MTLTSACQPTDKGVIPTLASHPRKPPYWLHLRYILLTIVSYFNLLEMNLLLLPSAVLQRSECSGFDTDQLFSGHSYCTFSSFSIISTHIGFFTELLVIF